MRKLLGFLLLVSASVSAQPTDKYVIKAGKIFDSEAGQFKSGMCILVNGEVIEGLKPEKDIPLFVSKNYKLTDLSKYTLLPGLIDCHTHLLYNLILMPNSVAVKMKDSLTMSPDLMRILTIDGDAYRALYGAAKAKGYLEQGITSVQDLGNSGQFADIALRRAINEGLVWGPRMHCSGPGLSTQGGQIPGVIAKHQQVINDEYRIVKSADDGVQAVRENIAQGADVIKIYADNSPNSTMLSVDEIKAITAEAHRYGIRVTAHAVNNRSVYNAVIGGVNSIEHGYEVDDTTLELMANKKIILVPTDGDSSFNLHIMHILEPTSYGYDSIIKARDYSRRSAPGSRLQRAIKKGVIIAAGSDEYGDFNFPAGVASKLTLTGYGQAGIPIIKILQFATVNAAIQLNSADKIGQIKPGFLADIIAVDNSIDQDIRAVLNVHFVMKGGKVYVNK